MKLRPIIQVAASAVVLALLVVSNPLAQQPGATPDGKQKSAKPGGVNQKSASKKSVSQKSAVQPSASQKSVDRKSGEAAHQSPKNVVAKSMAKGAGSGAIRSDEPMARLLKVDGDVLVSTESGLVAAEEGGVLLEGTRVITMANSSVVLAYSDGCSLSLNSNERIEISQALPCGERLDQVRLAVLDPSLEMLLEGQTASIPALALSGLLQGGAASTTGLAGLAALVAGREDAVVSPN